MLAYEFMRHALLAAGIIAILAAVTGYFLVLRQQSFAGHALSHVGFAGAAAALLIGAPPLAGLLVFAVIGGIAMGFWGERAADRDVAIGVVLAVTLGLGVLFLSGDVAAVWQYFWRGCANLEDIGRGLCGGVGWHGADLAQIAVCHVAPGISAGAWGGAACAIGRISGNCGVCGGGERADCGSAAGFYAAGGAGC